MTTRFYSEPLADVYKGNSLEVLKSLPDESVQMCMTSPPYWGLRTYEGAKVIWGGDPDCQHDWLAAASRSRSNPSALPKAADVTGSFCARCGAWFGTLGLEPTPDLFIEHLLAVFREVKRVLKRSGSLYVNIADTYTTGKGSCHNPGGGTASWQSWNDRKAEYPTGTAAPNRMYKGLSAKCRTLVPERLALALVDDGWILRNVIIWKKPNHMPGSQKSRFTSSWEYVYFLVKNNRPILWRNRQTAEWREKRPTREESYPLGGMYQHLPSGRYSWDKPPEEEKRDWIKALPLWASFDYYFELDNVRVPHTTESLERYQHGVNLGRPSIGKYGEVGSLQHYTRAPAWFKGMFGEDENYRGKFDDLFGHGPAAQSFNLRVRDVKRGKGGATAEGGEMRASPEEIEAYNYPERHHGNPFNNSLQLHRGRNGGKDAHRQKEDGRAHINDHLLRPPEPEVDPDRAFNPLGKNPGDTIVNNFDDTYWEITTKPYKGAHFAPYPPELCVRPILASTHPGDVVLDPFAGSGTTGTVAKKFGRKAVLIELVEKYCGLIRERLENTQPPLELKEEVGNNEGDNPVSPPPVVDGE